MKLHASVWYTSASSYYIASDFVHKEQNRCDKRRQAAGQLSRALQRYGPRALCVEHKAYGIGSGLNGGVNVLLTSQAADFDASTVGNGDHGSSLIVLRLVALE